MAKDDKGIENCERCSSKFTFFRRKHQCRLCQRIVCYSCSEHKISVPGHIDPVQACFDCKQRTEEAMERDLDEKRESQSPHKGLLSANNSNVFQFKYAFNGDKNGVVYNIGPENIKIWCSGMAKGRPEDFLARSKTWCWTRNEPNSWFGIDLGLNRVMYITQYTLRYANSGNYTCPRNWKLQGANTFSPSNNPADPNWHTIKTHTNDTSLNAEHHRHTWNVATGQAFRYFRVIQTGKNCFNPKNFPKDEEWSNVFVLSGFEMYGTLYTGSFASNVLSKKSSPAHEYKFRSTHDRNGVIHNLRNHSIRITCSRISKGNVEDFIERGKIHCWTANEPCSWFCVDLGPNRALVPNHYTFQYGSSGNYACPRSWSLQGSNTYNTSRSVNDPNWVTLRVHTNDASISSDYSAKTWSLDSVQAFRYFRIIQTGKNSYRVPPNTTDGWSDVLVASGFEIYGTLYDLDFSMCPCVEYPFTDTLEANGIIYHLGNHVIVTASAIGTGTAKGFTSRDKICNWTANQPNSWFCIDLGSGRSVWPTHYTLGYASGGNLCVPRNWKLQGSNQLPPMAGTSPDDPHWETLRVHTNDVTLNFDYEIASWEVKATKAYRYFRIIQTSRNAYAPAPNEVDNWGNVLAVNGFELYGTLYSGDGPKATTSYISPHLVNEMNAQNEMAASSSSSYSGVSAPGGSDRLIDTESKPSKEEEPIALDLFSCLPKELMAVIFSYLEGRMICQITSVSKRWKMVAEENALWRKMCIRDWQMKANDFFMTQDRDWKAIWIRSKFVPFTSNEPNVDDFEKDIYAYNGNPIGILHGLWSNSAETHFRVSCSGAQKGLPHEFLSRENTFCWTTNKKNSWYKLDLGKYVRVIPTHYLMKYGSSANYCVPRFWKFQASNEDRVDTSPDDETLWTTLRVHENDSSMNSDFSWNAYRVDESQTAYRYFRIMQHGQNAFAQKQSTTDVWSDVLVATGFDLFGLCIKLKPQPGDPVEIRQRV